MTLTDNTLVDARERSKDTSDRVATTGSLLGALTISSVNSVQIVDGGYDALACENYQKYSNSNLLNIKERT